MRFTRPGAIPVTGPARPAAPVDSSPVRFLSDTRPPYDLTYDDVFMVPRRSDVASRYDVDLAQDPGNGDGTGTTIPLVVANMTAVSGRRMAETMARRGGLSVIPQDIPLDVVEEVVGWVKQRHPVFETPITLSPQDTVSDALALLPEAGPPRGGRARGRAGRSASSPRPTAPASTGSPRSVDAMTTDMVTLKHTMEPREAFDVLASSRFRLAPAVDDDGALVGILTRTGALRSTIYRPALDQHGRLRIAAAIGVNGDVAGQGRSGCWRWGSTASSSTPRTVTRSGCSRPWAPSASRRTRRARRGRQRGRRRGRARPRRGGRRHHQGRRRARARCARPG